MRKRKATEKTTFIIYTDNTNPIDKEPMETGEKKKKHMNYETTTDVFV